MSGEPGNFSVEVVKHPRFVDMEKCIACGTCAEKCPKTLFDRACVLAPKSKLIEGYGITECSPIVSATREESNRFGSVGLPIPGVVVRVVDIETHQPLPQGEVGMLLVHGPNVFPGYIGEAADPFTQLEGKRWYVTGDLARIDDDGFIWLAGRCSTGKPSATSTVHLLPAPTSPGAPTRGPQPQGTIPCGGTSTTTTP